MTSAILRRLLHMVVVLLAMTGGTFLLMRLSPVDPVALHFVAMGTPADPVLAAQIRADLGLDDPLIVQYARWLGGLFTGDMGYSIAFGSPVAVLSVKLRLIPVVATDDLRGMILPSAALALWLAGLYIRRVRSALLEEAGKNYVLGARTLGLSERTVLWKYIMPNALMTLLPMLGITMGNIMGGSAVIETIFGWRGMGQLMTTAILARDYQLMQAYVLWGAGVFVTANFIADVLSLWLDPRRLQAKGARGL